MGTTKVLTKDDIALLMQDADPAGRFLYEVADKSSIPPANVFSVKITGNGNRTVEIIYLQQGRLDSGKVKMPGKAMTQVAPVLSSLVDQAYSHPDREIQSLGGAPSVYRKNNRGTQEYLSTL